MSTKKGRKTVQNKAADKDTSAGWLKVEAAPRKGLGVLRFKLGEKKVYLRWSDHFVGPEKNFSLKRTLCVKFDIPAFPYEKALEEYNKKKREESDVAFLMKAENQYYFDLFGPQVNRIATAVFLKNYFYIQPKSIQNMTVRRYGRSLRVDMDALKLALRSKKLIIQAEKDGLQNLVPLIVHTRKSPQELKKHFGKGLWKRIANQSYAANKRLGTFIFEYKFKERLGFFGDIEAALVAEFLSCKAYAQSIINAWMAYPNGRYMQPSLIAKVRKESISKKDLQLFFHTNELLLFYIDGCNLAVELSERNGTKLSLPKITSLKKIRRWHDEMVIENNKASIGLMSKTEFKLLDGVPDTFEALGCKFTRLRTELDLFIEGKIMHHCIHSYTNASSDGKLVSYSVAGGEKRATVSYWIDRGKVGINDLASYGNAQVDKQTELACDVLCVFLKSRFLSRKKAS